MPACSYQQGSLRAGRGRLPTCSGWRPSCDLAAGRRRLTALDLETAADRFVDLLVPSPRRGAVEGDSPVRAHAPPPDRSGAIPCASATSCWSGASVARLRRDGRSRDRSDTTVLPLRGRRQAGGPPGVPVRHGVQHRPLARGRREALVVNYHNVTPPEFYAAWDNPMARHQLLARPSSGARTRAALGLAVSWFNEAQLTGRLRPHRRGAPCREVHRAVQHAGRSRRGPGGRAPLGLRRAGRPEQGDRARAHGAPRGAAHDDPRRRSGSSAAPWFPPTRGRSSVHRRPRPAHAVDFRGPVSDDELTAPWPA